MCTSSSSVLLTFSVDFVNTRTLEASLVLQPQQTRKWCFRVTSTGTDSPSTEPPSIFLSFCSACCYPNVVILQTKHKACTHFPSNTPGLSCGYRITATWLIPWVCLVSLHQASQKQFPAATATGTGRFD